MKCADVQLFLSQINNRSINNKPSSDDIAYFENGGYVKLLSKQDHDSLEQEIAKLQKLNDNLNNERLQEMADEETLKQDEKKAHSFFFHFKGAQTKDELRRKIEAEKETVEKEKTELSQDEKRVRDLIEKKSSFDRYVQLDDSKYVALTDRGIITLNELNVRNYRVADKEFSDFSTEMRDTEYALRRIAANANLYAHHLGDKLFEYTSFQNDEEDDD